MDDSELSAIKHYYKDMQCKVLATTKVLKNLHQNKVLNDKEKMDLLKIRDNAEKIRQIVNITKKKPGGFSAFCKALLEEKHTNQFIVEKLETKVKEIKLSQTKQASRAEEQTKAINPEVQQSFHKVYRIVHGQTKDSNTEIDSDSIEKLVENLQKCRNELTENLADRRSLHHIIIEQKTENMVLRHDNLQHKQTISELENRLLLVEHRRRNAEEDLEELKRTIEEKIKTGVEEAVKKRLTSLPYQDMPIKVTEESGDEDNTESDDELEEDYGYGIDDMSLQDSICIEEKSDSFVSCEPEQLQQDSSDIDIDLSSNKYIVIKNAKNVNIFGK